MYIFGIISSVFIIAIVSTSLYSMANRSTLQDSNQESSQSSSESISARPLVATENTQVAVFEACDMAIKTPNFFENELGQFSYNIKNREQFLFSDKFTNSIAVFTNYPAGVGATPYMDFGCADQALNIEDFTQIKTNSDGTLSYEDEREWPFDRPTIDIVTKETVCIDTNLTEPACEKITPLFKITTRSSDSDITSHVYKTEDKTYIHSYFPINVGVFVLQFDSLAPSEATVEIIQTSQTQPSVSSTLNYTNEFYPSLNLVYDSTWEMTTSTEPSGYAGYLSREVVMKKGDTTATYNITPYPITGCGGYDESSPKSQQLATIRDGLYSYKVGNSVVYSSEMGSIYPECFLSRIFFIDSTLGVPKEFDYMGEEVLNNMFPGGKFKAAITVEVSGTTHLSEFEEFLKQSNFSN